MIAGGKQEYKDAIDQGRWAGAPPSETMLTAMGDGFDITHVYGLTEVYGPVTVCAEQPNGKTWTSLTRAKVASRRGFTLNDRL